MSPQDRLECITGELLRDIVGGRYAVVYNQGADTKTVCEKTMRILFPALDNMIITHDSSGAPIVTVHHGGSRATPIVSLTDEDGASACFAIVPAEASRIIGVGIDIANIDDISSSLLATPHRRLSRAFFPDEANYILSLPSHKRAARLASVFAAKEAAFKSLSRIYSVYRAENNDEPLDVSMMDFGFAESGKPLNIAKARGISAEICTRENLEILCRTAIMGDYAGAVVMCRQKSRYSLNTDTP